LIVNKISLSLSLSLSLSVKVLLTIVQTAGRLEEKVACEADDEQVEERET
jgi:hypothetical protein